MVDTLARIREALKQRTTAPKPDSAANISPRAWLPKVPVDLAGQVNLFAERCQELRAQFVPVPDFAAARGALLKMLGAGKWTKVATHRGTSTETICADFPVPVLYTDSGIRGLENAEVGITACDALIAQTGSVLLSNRSAGGRALSVLPPHHIVIATSGQMKPDLPSAFAHIAVTYGDRPPSSISLVTGPSRTGDIERILVLGAHGPRFLTIFWIENDHVTN